MKKTVEVIQTVEVEVDEETFTDEFMNEYRETFYQFQTIDDHIKHIAQMEARGLLPATGYGFVEGYGYINIMGIKAEVIDQVEEIDC